MRRLKLSDLSDFIKAVQLVEGGDRAPPWLIPGSAHLTIWQLLPGKYGVILKENPRRPKGIVQKEHSRSEICEAF